MTNPPAADEPVNGADQPRAAAEHEAATGAPAPHSDAEKRTDTPDEPRFEADYLPEGAPPEPAAWPTDEPAAAQVDAPTTEPATEPMTEPAATKELPSEPETTELEAPEPVSAEPEAQEPPSYEPPSTEPPLTEPPLGAVPPPFGGMPPGATPPPGQMPPGQMPPGDIPPGGMPPGGMPPGAVPPYGAGFNRAGLVRPQQGRYVAGVCAAIGRATNTDPTLWRVIFAVLTLAGGVSIVAYLLGWLLLPAEGDTASPLEALLGRGRSATSAPVAIIIAVGAVLAFLLVMSRNIGAAAVGLAVVIGVVALLVRNQGDRPPAPAGPFVPQPPGPPPGVPFAPSVPPYTPATPMQAAAPATVPTMAPPVTMPHPPVPPPSSVPPVAPIPPSPPFPPTLKLPSPQLPPAPPAMVPGYRQPFAPHGPYAAKSPYAASLGYPPPGGPPGSPYPGLVPVPPKPPKPPRERSKLGRLIFSMICLALGVMAALEVTVADFKVSAFFAVPLGIVALGLILGAWIGRARVMILLGALLSIALAISTASTMDNGRPPQDVADIDIAPTSVNELERSYSTDVGDIRADLSAINFVDQDVEVSFRVGYGGSIRIVVPPNVDVTVKTDVDGGDCRVFGRDCSGFNQNREFTDLGADGAGGGKLELDLDLRFGELEVTR